MPEAEYVWLPRASILSFEELDRLTGVFVGLGVQKVRLTGGEPLLRHDLPALVRLLAARAPELADLALTTNGVLLAAQAAALRAAGLHRVTVSLDTLRPERMVQYAGGRHHAAVLAGIEAAQGVGLRVKLNAVVMRSQNLDEMAELLAFAWARGLVLRFIEYMDVGGATGWEPGEVVSRREMLARVRNAFGPVTEIPRDDPAAPAEEFECGAGRFGIVASTTAPFCGACDRSRITADGTWYGCLYAPAGVDLRSLLRGGADDATLAGVIREAWERRRDRGAEERMTLAARGPLASVEALRADAHLEMHTRGG